MARLKKHRDTYVTLEDFKWIKAHGLDTVRIRCRTSFFGDAPAFCDPYVPCIEYLDKAFDWAEETGLKILIDLHTAPDSQNGFDNGGICGVCKFWQKPENEARVIKVLGMLSARYADRPALFGVQIFEQPFPRAVESTSRALPARRPRICGRAAAVPFEFLCSFYKKGVKEIRRYLGEDKGCHVP